MKLRTFLFVIQLLVGMAACINKVDPDVDTMYTEDGKDRKDARMLAIPKLLAHYSSSKKDKLVYEVISKKKGQYILNFTPSLKLLTLCGDPGSGWGPQFKDVDEATLQKLINDGISFEDIHSIGTIDSKFDSVLVRNEPRVEVKTNGEPSL
ncbi:hypothetical protein [Dyadobacter sp.]|uniref:hypothetical protein n=1 Tax=Dyadobacter sp. TaxID=1914288 RepID=UPI003F724001